MIFSPLKSGNKAETFACKFLSRKGYKIISRNYRTKFGEIDIIAQDEDILCFVEVKYRKNSDFGNPEDFVDFRKQKKLLKTAKIYLAQKRISEVNIRFDIIGLVSDSKNKYIAKLIKNAFEDDNYG